LSGMSVACGGGSSSSGGTSTATIRGAWETYARVDCAKGHEGRSTQPGTAAEFEYDYGASLAECTAELQDPEFEADVRAYEDAAAHGRLGYDAVNAQTCFEAWA